MFLDFLPSIPRISPWPNYNEGKQLRHNILDRGAVRHHGMVHFAVGSAYTWMDMDKNQTQSMADHHKMLLTSGFLVVLARTILKHSNGSPSPRPSAHAVNSILGFKIAPPPPACASAVAALTVDKRAANATPLGWIIGARKEGKDGLECGVMRMINGSNDDV